jgi:hypothetical protein
MERSAAGESALPAVAEEKSLDVFVRLDDGG